MNEQVFKEQAPDKQDSAFVADSPLVGAPIKSIPKPEQNVGLDTHDTLFQNIIYAGESSHLDISQIENFSAVAQSREQVYQLIDSMCNDPTISAVLEAYAEDATEYNDQGKIVWAESTDSEVAKYVTFLLDTLNIDKTIYGWVYSLCKYGDLYIHLFRNSELKDAIFDEVNQRSKLHEQVQIVAFQDSDKFGNYIEKVPNPAEMFELTKFGKTYGFIKADVDTLSKENNWVTPTYRYKFQQKDVDIYGAREFVHACLEDDANRNPEEVSIFTTADENGVETEYNYSVRKGQSLLYNVFKIWRELMLLKNSILLNRLTKSAIVRVIGIEVGDMEKADVEHRTRAVKNLIEQKTAINKDNSINEYTNPGPIENNIYVPTRNGIGAITTSQIGGDVDVKSLADLDFFNNELFGALRVPKQYFGFTDDGAGFNGGTSLAIISSRYAKMVKRIQNTVIQALTDMVNILLIDRGLGNYVNKFQIHMLPPTTQEEIDRRDSTSNKIQLARDVMDIVSSDVEEPIAKLRILKLLLSNVITDPEIIEILQEEIDKMEEEPVEQEIPEEGDDDLVDRIDVDINDNRPSGGRAGGPEMPDMGGSEETTEEPTEVETEVGTLPTPDELGMDFTDNGQF